MEVSEPSFKKVLTKKFHFPTKFSTPVKNPVENLMRSVKTGVGKNQKCFVWYRKNAVGKEKAKACGKSAENCLKR